LSFWHDIKRTPVDNATAKKSKHFSNDFVFMLG
jgi:hypothetical protein